MERERDKEGSEGVEGCLIGGQRSAVSGLETANNEKRPNGTLPNQLVILWSSNLSSVCPERVKKTQKLNQGHSQEAQHLERPQTMTEGWCKLNHTKSIRIRI